FVLATLATANVSASTATPQVDVIEVDGTVNPTLVDYIDRGISQAEKDGAVACIITLDTPGGLLSSTGDIVNRIMRAEVPVVVYVDPWAGSAGTFITIAAHVAAMAPGSRIGAASPVAGGGEEIDETMKKKITQDTAAWIESIAEERGRNKKAAIAAVAEAASYTDKEALGLDEIEGWEELGLDSPLLDPPLVDLGADNLTQLLEKLDGREVTLQSGETITLHTKDAYPNYVKMSTIEGFLFAISDPNIAYILLSIAMLGILIELSHPGLIFPGVVGGVSLLLSIYSLGMLEANWAGLLLIIFALGLFIAEVFTAGFGLLFAGGVVSLVMGSIILFGGTTFEIDARVIAAVVIIFTAIFAFIIFAIIRAHRIPINTGKEGMVGRVAVARTQLDPSGMVFVEGALWTATTEGDKIELGEEVIVTEVEGLKLKVVKKSK
ncbi:MAG TPA: nodulation protein NfeD, partial [Dehalococcoidia bacterium]|nr:nodulation protein NfeD [Dehalococcoidia bacterium]